MKVIRALLFDLDGTLIDSASDITRCLNVVLKSHGFGERKVEEVQRCIGDGVLTLLERATGIKDREQLEEMAKVFKPYYAKHCLEKTELYPGVKKILQHFHHKKMAIVSNKPYEMVLKNLQHFSLRNYFQVVFGAESIANRKPHPEPVRKALEILTVRPEEALVVGDGTTDILSGKSAGTWTCAVTYGYRPKEELLALKPDFVIDRIIDLKKVIC